MLVSKHIGKIMMGKHMIVACIMLSSLSINVADNDVQRNVYQLKGMKRTLKANIVQRHILEKRNTDLERNTDKSMHAINNVEERTEFQLQNHIDNDASINTIEGRNLKKDDTVIGQLGPKILKVANAPTHRANQINKREPMDSNEIDVSYSLCHVKEVCDDQEDGSNPCSIIIPREEWKARKTKAAKHMTVPVRNVFIHHTAMDRCNSLETCSFEMRKIQNFHMDEKGWDDIGYSFLVGDDGKAYEARGWDRVGAHTRGWNDKSISIAVMGNFNFQLPSVPALKAIDRLISCGIDRDTVLPYYNLYGHRDAASQFDSPGHMLYDMMQNWSHFKTRTS
ncbi:hypothetical protein ACJMK2_004174 [Sinanodonta woodiana]|uniref:Peptidoglycan recognition protein n=2 Tax=Sinanodonta woodiana TaxID=1069815 RepID=A0ABD3Y0D2_SINWO